MNKNLGIAILIIALTFTVGCSSGSILKPTPTSSIPTLAQQILSQSISTMANITSCSLYIDVQEPYTFICTNERQCGDMYTNISQWNGTKISQWNGTEITNQNESVIMINESPYGGQVIPCETYAADGRWWVVGASYLNDSYSGQWAPNDQYPQQINLMKTAINASLASDEIDL